MRGPKCPGQFWWCVQWAVRRRLSDRTQLVVFRQPPGALIRHRWIITGRPLMFPAHETDTRAVPAMQILMGSFIMYHILTRLMYNLNAKCGAERLLLPVCRLLLRVCEGSPERKKLAYRTKKKNWRHTEPGTFRITRRMQPEVFEMPRRHNYL